MTLMTQMLLKIFSQNFQKIFKMITKIAVNSLLKKNKKSNKLIEDHENTIEKYNKGMKQKNKLSITGYSSYSELNNSKNISISNKNNTILFGQNMVNTSKSDSEMSMLKVKSCIEEENPNSPDKSPDNIPNNPD